MRRSYALLAALLLTTPAFAADTAATDQTLAKAPSGTYALEKTHASITFNVMHMGFARYTARFNDFDASYTLDPATPENSKLTVTIRPASLDANNEKLTAHTNNSDFFNVEKYPTITFTSTRIERTGDTTGKIHGEMTMLGVTKPVVLDATFNGGGMHPHFKTYAMGFSAVTTIKRSEFGMNYGIPMVGDDVHAAIEVEFLKQ